MSAALILYLLGAYITWLFCVNLSAERNVWLALLIICWPLPVALMMLTGMVELFSDWWEGRNGD